MNKEKKGETMGYLAWGITYIGAWIIRFGMFVGGVEWGDDFMDNFVKEFNK